MGYLNRHETLKRKKKKKEEEEEKEERTSKKGKKVCGREITQL